MSLQSNDLYGKHDKLIELKKNTYDKLHVRCENLIKLTSNTGKLMCFFVIPTFLFGSEYPLINIESCSNYIKNKLLKSYPDMRTVFIEPNLIFIDWRRKSDMDSSPIDLLDIGFDTKTDIKYDSKSIKKYKTK